MRIELGPSLDAAKESALLTIDAEAERRRSVLGGSTVAHALKRAEAERLVDDVAPDPGSYPMLSAEVGITAPSLSEVGLAVAVRSDAWKVALAQIETARLVAKQAIRQAGGPPEVRAAVRLYLGSAIAQTSAPKGAQ